LEVRPVILLKVIRFARVVMTAHKRSTDSCGGKVAERVECPGGGPAALRQGLGRGRSKPVGPMAMLPAMEGFAEDARPTIVFAMPALDWKPFSPGQTPTLMGRGPILGTNAINRSAAVYQVTGIDVVTDFQNGKNRHSRGDGPIKARRGSRETPDVFIVLTYGPGASRRDWLEPPQTPIIRTGR